MSTWGSCLPPGYICLESYFHNVSVSFPFSFLKISLLDGFTYKAYPFYLAHKINHCLDKTKSRIDPFSSLIITFTLLKTLRCIFKVLCQNLRYLYILHLWGHSSVIVTFSDSKSLPIYDAKAKTLPPPNTSAESWYSQTWVPGAFQDGIRCLGL